MAAPNIASAVLGFSLIAIALSGCRTDKRDTAEECGVPIANAGVDASSTVDNAVTLDAASSEICDRLSPTYSWSFESVPIDSQVDDSTFTDNNSDSAVQVSFEPDVVGTYVVSLSVNDGINMSASDLVVIDIVSGNERPAADCGDNLTGEIDEIIKLDGSASTDPEGSELEFAWSLATVPAESSLASTELFDASGPTPTLVPDVAGVFVASLIVSDGDQWSDPDYCSISVGSGNETPYADAGESAVYPPCTDDSVALNGYGSYDPEGVALEYLWSVVTVPAGSTATDSNIDDATLPNPLFTWDTSGEYTFQLMVSDGEIWSAPDLVALEIVDRDYNEAPEANAGDDQTISVSADCTSTSYVWACEDCSESSVDLDGSGSDAEDGDDITFSWTDSSGLLQIAAPNSAYTAVSTPSLEASFGSTTTTTYSVELTVSDCELSDTDSVDIEVSCTGES
jgi:hypothetical protein